MKKKLLKLLFAIGILTVGCGKSEVNVEKDKNESDVKNEMVEEITYPVETLNFAELENLEFYFASGAGGWRTVMQIDSDGSFEGVYSDGDMGDIGEEYPNGTYYYCEFEGKFTEPVKVNDYTFAMDIEEIDFAKKPDTTEIIDGTLYCYSTSYGLDGAEELLIYLPGAPTSELPEEYMNWVRNDMADPEALELPFYGLYNVTEQNGFSSHEYSSYIDDMMAATDEWAITIRASLEHDDLNQAEMNVKSMELYETWDAALNTLWSELKERLSDDEFKALLEEQRVWIADKEAAVKEAGKEVEGGSLYALVINMKAAEITEERVYELYEILKENE